MYEQDPDILWWGLHLLHGDPLSNIGCCEIPIENVDSFESGVHASESNIGTDHTNVENDEILAHALQEELSQIAAREASGSSLAVDELSQASVLAQDWLDFSARYTHSGLSFENSIVLLRGLLCDSLFFIFQLFIHLVFFIRN